MLQVNLCGHTMFTGKGNNISGERGATKELPCVVLTAEAQAQLNALPAQFLDWYEMHTAELDLAA